MAANIELARYGVEHIPLRTPDEVPIGNYVGSVAMDRGRSLYFYAALRSAHTLRVVLHGAVRAGVDTYPRFDRVSSSKDTEDAFLSIADPTIGAHPGISLAWYLGGDGWDPLATIAALVRAAARATGADSIVIIGGSGGGYAALRLGLAVPDALVYCFNPQTAVLRYWRSHVVSYFRNAHGRDRTPESIVASEPSRFDLLHAYVNSDARPLVFYTQNIRDAHHVADHYVPFKRGLGVRAADGDTADGRIRFLLVDSEREEHGPPYAHEFREQLLAAQRWAQRVRVARSSVPA